MAPKYVLDTHALIWYLEGNSRLGLAAKGVMDDPSSEMVLPIIALAEAAYIVDKGRTRLPSVANLLADLFGDARIEVYPLTIGVFQRTLGVASVPEMHDRLIVATAMYLESMGTPAVLLTKDSTIGAAGLVPIVW